MRIGTKLLSLFATTITVYFLTTILNLLLGTYIWFPRYEWHWIFIPLPEAAAAALMLLGLGSLTKPSHDSAIRHRTTSRVVRILLLLFSGIFLVLLIFSVSEAFFQHIYMRTFDIRANLPLFSHFFNMLFATEIFSRPLMLILPTATLFGAMGILFWYLFRLLVHPLGRLPRKPAITTGAVLFLVSLIAIPAQPAAERLMVQLLFYEKNKGIPPTPHLDSSSSYGAYLNTHPNSFALPGIQDKNVHIFIVESYGTTIFTNPHHFNRMEEFYRQQESLLQQDGFSILSHAYDSTTFGGTSWLADATILSGIELRTQSHYDQAVKQGTGNLLHLLGRANYRRILSAPGTNFMTDDYTGFYSYDTYILHDDFEYTGPFFTFGKLPDQYQMHYIHSQIIDHSSMQPHFVQYILCSSHVPWNYIPPYIDTWEELENGNIYYNRERNTWYDNSWAVGSELFEGYTHSIRYSLESVFGYARTHLEQDDILIVIGDHQPKFPVSEKEAGFGVPIHIIGKDRSILLPFLRFGYGLGILPPQTENLPGLERFLNHFLTVAEGRFLQPRPSNAPLPIPK